jgi:hypothetical protein
MASLHRNEVLAAVFISVAALAGVQATPALNHALVRDIMPPKSSQCVDTGLTKFNFNFTTINQDTSNWSSLHKEQEQEVFMAEMSNGLSLNHTDVENGGADAQGWTLRVGKAGVIYSFIGAYGEAMPPQGGAHSPWNDEVWQQTMTHRPKNSPDAGGLYMIHQAGVYLYDDALTGIYPSPYALGRTSTLRDPGVALSCEGNSCAFVSWGQHAHIPTPHPSNALYYTRVADCGTGIMEYTMVTHNMAVNDGSAGTTADFFDLFTSPWMGFRGNTFRDVLTTADQPADGTGKAVVVKPRPDFLTNARPQMQTTLGYTVFTEGISGDDIMEDFTFPCADQDNRFKEVPCTGNSTVDIQPEVRIAKATNACALSSGHTINYGKDVFFCWIEPTETSRIGALYEDIVLYNKKTPEQTLLVRGVLYYAWGGNKIFFFGNDDIDDLKFMRENFPLVGDEISFAYVDIGVPYEDNHAIAMVHGTWNTGALQSWMVRQGTPDWYHHLKGDWQASYIVFGHGASMARDVIVFVSTTPYCHIMLCCVVFSFSSTCFYVFEPFFNK